jgi:hypothetical protein
MKTLVSRAYNGLFRHDLWNVGIVHNPIAMFLRHDLRPQIQWFSPAGPGKFFADPFGILKDGRLYILCEEYDYRTQRGKIVSCEISAGTMASQPVPVIEGSSHFAYPYLIIKDHQVFCIPDTYQTREVALYRALNFPNRWEKLATLIENFGAIDSTIFQHDGRWWLFCSDKDTGPLDKLYVWYSDELSGPWMPHSTKPVKSDIGSSRSAGTPFVHNGSLYRPAQDNSRTYGGGIVINRIVKLTPTEFIERPVSYVPPYKESPWPDGVHTLSAVGNLTLIDAKRLVFLRDAFKHVLTKNLGKLVHD